MLRTAALIAAFAATIPAANWLIRNVGTECVPDGPCLLPVGFGLYAPSGVLMIGASLVLRDLVHEGGGFKAALLAIAIGGVTSILVAPGGLVLASVSAFVLAELADLAVYAPLRRKGFGLAILMSGIAGSIIDSAVFLWLAFGSLDFLAGQIVGKVWMSFFAGVAVCLCRNQPKEMP